MSSKPKPDAIDTNDKLIASEKEKFFSESSDSNDKISKESVAEFEFELNDSADINEPSEMSNVDVNGNGNVNDNDNVNANQTVVEPEAPVEKKKRGMPKAMLANQQKYLEALEKQQRMIKTNKEKSAGKEIAKQIKTSKAPELVIPTQAIQSAETRRVIVSGKVRYIPIKNTKPIEAECMVDDNDLKDIPIFKKDTNGANGAKSTNNVINAIDAININNATNAKTNNKDTIDVPKRIPTTLKQKMEAHQASVSKKEPSRPPKGSISVESKGIGNTKVPSKYAKQIENDIKRQTEKNVKNFADLRRLKAIQSINQDTAIIDTTKASVIELRKLRIEQRKHEQAVAKQTAVANKRESAIQEILRNDKMSKFAKTVAIKNLSVNSRTRKNTKTPQIGAKLQILATTPQAVI